MARIHPSVSVYRGGISLRFRRDEVKIDPLTGLLRTTYGISVDTDPEFVRRFGGAFRITNVPEGLEIIQRGRRPEHFEIVPAYPMTEDRYQELLDKIDLEPVN